VVKDPQIFLLVAAKLHFEKRRTSRNILQMWTDSGHVVVPKLRTAWRLASGAIVVERRARK
jgi:hypothetical protein